MTATHLRGKDIANEIRATIRIYLQTCATPPCLAAVCVGNDPATEFYMGSQKRSAEKLGIEYKPVILEDSASQEELCATLAELSNNHAVDGIILLTPLPKGMDIFEVRKSIASCKDVEGVTPSAIGHLALSQDVPAAPTAYAAYLLAKRHLTNLAGVETVVAGYSDTVGKPLTFLLLNDKATVTVLRSRVKDIQEHISRADLVFAAMGKARYILGEWLKPGATVIDVGTNEIDEKTEDGGTKKAWVGDVDFEAAESVASAITPVPGGVGTVTTAILFQNLIHLVRTKSCRG